MAPVARGLGAAVLLAGTVAVAQAQSVLRVAMAPETTPAEQEARFASLATGTHFTRSL